MLSPAKTPFPLLAMLSSAFRKSHLGFMLLGATPAVMPTGAGAAPAERAVLPFPSLPPRPVPAAVMQQVYEDVRTPHKVGVILKGEPGEMIDCPNVFRHEGRWYMVYVAIRDKVGYQTYLARSDDLVHWEKLGRILSFSQGTWDAWQADAGLALYDLRWDGADHQLRRHDGRYWMSYIGGALQGYETDPLSIGMVWSRQPTAVAEWNRIPENPVLSISQPEIRNFETATLYKSAIIHDETRSLGWSYIMYYNAKTRQTTNHEAIGMAVSNDMITWTRLGAEPVIDNAPGKPAISGDPQIARIGDVWVMFYFGYRWKPNAFDTFACSYDLVQWTKWGGANLIEPSEPYDKTFAHKPWLIKHEGVVYHFYCAVGDQGRVIALATSRPLPVGVTPTP